VTRVAGILPRGELAKAQEGDGEAGGSRVDRPSLEALVEAEDLGLEILHPGGLAITRNLARVTGVVTGTRVLEIAAGTGETARLPAAECGARVTATDMSPRMVRRLRDKFSAQESAVQIV